jgi:hypothetical protein
MTRKITIPVEVEIGTIHEVGFMLAMEGAEGTDPENPDLKFRANPSIGGIAMQFSAHNNATKRDAWAKVSFKELIQQVWTELDGEIKQGEKEAVAGS